MLMPPIDVAPQNPPSVERNLQQVITTACCTQLGCTQLPSVISALTTARHELEILYSSTFALDLPRPRCCRCLEMSCLCPNIAHIFGIELG